MTPHLPAMRPADGALYVVRWRPPLHTRGDVMHRYYRRRHDAERFHLRMWNSGIEAELFVTHVVWQEVD